MTSISQDPWIQLAYTFLQREIPPLVSGRTRIYENVVPIELNPLQNGAVGIPLAQVMVEFTHYH